MQKALFYIIASENDRGRAIMGLNVARRSHEFKRFADVKVIIQGPSQKLIVDEDEEVKSLIDYLIRNRMMDSACSNFARKLQLEGPIQDRGVELKPSGERLAALVNDGYVPLVF